MLNSTAIFDFLKPKTPLNMKEHKPSKKQSYLDAAMLAITKLGELEDEQRRPSLPEIEILKGFDGYGKLTKALNNSHPRHNELKTLLNEFGPNYFEAAQRGVLSSYYTPKMITDAMWRTVMRLGLTEGHIIEPSAGNGAFIHRCPSNFKAKFHAIEMDPLSAKFLKMTTDHHVTVKQCRLEEAKFNHLDYAMAIGNPPYGDIYARNKDEFGKKIKILPYFFLRSLKEVHVGGFVAFVASSWFMDNQDTSLREKFAEQAKLIACVRLPSNAFDKQGASGITTDILIFQKTHPNSESPLWIDTEEVNENRINSHFAKHPEHIAGTLAPANPFSFGSCTVNAEGDTEQQIIDILDAQSTEALYYQPTINKGVKRSEEAETITANPDQNLSNHELFIQNNEIFEHNLDLEKPRNIKQSFSSPSLQKRVTSYIFVKDALKALLNAEMQNEDDETLNKLRYILRTLHSDFVKTFGPLSRTINKSKLRGCSQFLRTRALELNYSPKCKESEQEERYTNSKILTERVYTPHTKPSSASNTTEACVYSILEHGHINANYLGQLLNDTPGSALTRCLEEKAIFLNPTTNKHELSASYLSGNITQKLKAIDTATNPEAFSFNRKALEEVKPTPITFDKIHISIGATWIDPKIYAQFVESLLGPKCKAKMLLIYGKWELNFNNYDYKLLRTLQTGDKSFEDILLAVMNTKPLVVRRQDDIGSYVDRQATFEANEKAEEIEQRFDEWVGQCPERRIAITASYNEQMNSYVVPNYETVAQHITIDNCTLTPRPHQLRAATRAILNTTSFGDLAVGAGKTATLQIICQLLKKIHGPSHNNLIVMPNPLVEQFTTAYIETFPAANVLCIPDKTPVKEREALLHLATTNNFDAIIMPLTTFTALEAPRQTTMRLIQKDIDDLREAILIAKDFNLGGREQKNLERKLEKAENDLEEITTKDELESIGFEDLNVRFLALDEAQVAKNLSFFTSMSGVRGMGNPNGSKRAYDFYIKSRHLVEEKEGKVFLTTGTSISNSVVELVSWMRMLDNNTYQDNLLQVDNFIKTFAKPSTQLDLDGTGRNLKLQTSIKKFSNLPELLSIYRTLAEVVSMDDLKNNLPPLPDGRPAIPPFANGQIKNEMLPISPEQNEFFLELVKKAENITKENNMLKIIDSARKASLDIRHISSDHAPTNTVTDKIIENVVKHYRQSREYNGTQLIVCDRSVSSRHRNDEATRLKKLYERAENGDEKALEETKDIDLDQALSFLGSSFSVYDELERRLNDMGIKTVVAHDFKTDSQKNKLKAKLNSGEYAVCIGSTVKIATGFNVQERLIAIHHADLPLKSGCFFQRNGRIERVGNKAYEQGFINEIHAYTYTTERTLDSWMLALIGTKANYIQQFNNGKLDGIREYEPSEEVINFQQLSAHVTGNTEIIELAEKKTALKKLQLKKRSIVSRVRRAEEEIEYSSSKIDKLTQQLDQLQADQEAASQTQAPLYQHTDLNLSENLEVLQRCLEVFKRQSRYNDRDWKSICHVGNFELQGRYGPYGYEYDLHGESVHEVEVLNAHVGYIGLNNAIERTLAKICNAHTSATGLIERLSKSIEFAQTELKLTFNDDETISEYKTRISQLENILANKEAAEREQRLKEKAEEEAKAQQAT
ncbi:N-6 DNA methylase [Vibrio sp. PNB22_3_1]